MAPFDVSPAVVFLAQAALALWALLMLVSALSWAAVKLTRRKLGSAADGSALRNRRRFGERIEPVFVEPGVEPASMGLPRAP